MDGRLFKAHIVLFTAPTAADAVQAIKKISNEDGDNERRLHRNR